MLLHSWATTIWAGGRCAPILVGLRVLARSVCSRYSSLIGVPWLPPSVGVILLLRRWLMDAISGYPMRPSAAPLSMSQYRTAGWYSPSPLATSADVLGEISGMVVSVFVTGSFFSSWSDSFTQGQRFVMFFVNDYSCFGVL